MIEYPSKLETTRLIIRKYENGDGKELYQLLEKNKVKFFYDVREE